MLKQWKAARKLRKFRKLNPQQNINPITGQVIIDESHMVCFVNDEYPMTHILLAVIDATSTWLYNNSSTKEAMMWHNRRSTPIIYKVDASFEMNRLIESPSLPQSKTISFFAGEPIAICIGPMWNSVINEYNIPYERIEYD